MQHHNAHFFRSETAFLGRSLTNSLSLPALYEIIATIFGNDGAPGTLFYGKSKNPAR
jgi:hypothetical protein